jgi:ribosomal protein S16
MAIRLRLAMHGHRHRKVFHIVAIDSGLRREAKPTELLGVYDPHKTEDDARVIRWSVSRIRYWLNVGAIPSKSVLKMLELVSLTFSFLQSCPECQVTVLTYELLGRYCQTWLATS